MYQDLFNNGTAQFENLFAPARKFNSALVDHLEKLTRFQLETAKSYADMSVEQLRAALEVNDVDSLQAYVSKQSGVASTLSKKLGEDANTLAGLGKDFAQELQQLTQENVSVFAEAAQPKKAAPRAAARKSA
ncbi:phasin family protein [Alkalilimnicola sp. S0819]|uniref:phasin family protein n=1 Tax=Alkalilimnicola sp. S0819 TaxID=2613922 RepID=UPI00186A7964|nr:phasin family protein [Alkalilimnicola sp. S0819]